MHRNATRDDAFMEKFTTSDEGEEEGLSSTLLSEEFRSTRAFFSSTSENERRRLVSPVRMPYARATSHTGAQTHACTRALATATCVTQLRTHALIVRTAISLTLDASMDESP